MIKFKQLPKSYILEVWEFTKKFSDSLKDGHEFTEYQANYILNEALSMIKDYDASLKLKFEFHIGMIYDGIIQSKYYQEDSYLNISLISWIVENILALKNDWDFNYYPTRKKVEMCKRVYNNKFKFDKSRIPSKMEEEFKLSHLTDLEYHLEKLAIIGEHKNDVDFMDHLNKYRSIYSCKYILEEIENGSTR